MLKYVVKVVVITYMVLVTVIPVLAYDPAVYEGCLYLGNGRKTLEGSKRFALDEDTGHAEVQRLLNGVWQPTTFDVSTDSLNLGHGVAAAAIGGNIAAEHPDGTYLIPVYVEFDGEVTTSKSKAVNISDFTESVSFQPDDSAEWSGTSKGFTINPQSHTLLKKLSAKTGSIAATEYIDLKIWQGTDEAGILKLHQKYPASNFTANTTVDLVLNGMLDFKAGLPFFFKYSSASNFSLKTNAAGNFPWMQVDYSLVRLDNLLQTKPWVDGDTWDDGDYCIDSGKLYICNTTGEQTGTFASNSVLWNEFGTVAQFSSTFGDETGLIIDLPFSEIGTGVTQYDRSPNPLTFSLQGTPVTADGYGKYGTGVRFLEATAQRFYTADAPKLNTWTVEAWVKPTTITGMRPFFAKDVSGYGNDLMIGLNPDIDMTEGRWGVSFQRGGFQQIEGNAAVVSGQWYHIVATYDDTNMKLYIDGVLQGTLAGVDFWIDGTLEIGGNAYQGRWFDGYMDYIKVYDRAISAEEVNTYYLRTGGSSVIKSDNFKVIDSNGDVNILVNDDDQTEVTDLMVNGEAWINLLKSANWEMHDLSRNRIEVDSNLIKLFSPDGLTTMTQTDTGHTFMGSNRTSTAIHIKPFEWTGSGHFAKMTLGDANNYVLAEKGQGIEIGSDTGVRLKYGSTELLHAMSTYIRMWSPDQTHSVSCQNGDVEIGGTMNALAWPMGIDLNNNDFNVTLNNNTNLFTVNTSGDLSAVGSISNGIDTNSYIIANRMGQNYAGGAMAFMGAENGSGVDYTNFNLDNFWGYFRIYGADNSNDTYVRVQNVGTKNMNLAIDGGIMVGDGASYKTASAGIEIKSTTEALLLSRMTTTQRDALTAVAGMVIFNTTTSKGQMYDGTVWQDLW